MTQNKLRVKGVNSGGGGISNPIITFTKANYATDVDVVSQYLTLKRGDNQGLFNTNEASTFGDTYEGGITHLWLSEPIIDLYSVSGSINLGSNPPADLSKVVIDFKYTNQYVTDWKLGGTYISNLLNGQELTADENGNYTFNFDTSLITPENPEDLAFVLPSPNLNDYQIDFKVYVNEEGWTNYLGGSMTIDSITPVPNNSFNFEFFQNNLWSTFNPTSIDIDSLISFYGDINFQSNGVQNQQMVPWRTANCGNPLLALGKEMIMLDVQDRKFYKVKFTQWTSGNAGGGLSYTRQLFTNTPTTTTTTTAAPTTTTTTTTVSMPQFNTSSSYFIDSVETNFIIGKKGVGTLEAGVILNVSNVSSYLDDNGLDINKLDIRVLNYNIDPNLGADLSTWDVVVDENTGLIASSYTHLQFVSHEALSSPSYLTDNYSDIVLQLIYNQTEILETRSLFNGTISGGTLPANKVYTLGGFDVATAGGFINTMINNYVNANSLTWDGTYNFVVNGEMGPSKSIYFLDNNGYKHLLDTTLSIPLHIPLVGSEIGSPDYLFTIENGVITNIGNQFTTTYVEDYVEPAPTTTTTTTAAPVITFTKANYGTNVDVVSQYLTLKRGNNQGLFNTNEMSVYGMFGGVNHLWSSEPLSGIIKISGTGYIFENIWSTFDASSIDISELQSTWTGGMVPIGFNSPMVPWEILHGGNPLEMLNKEAVMLDVLDGKFYKVKFTQWTSGNAGGGLSYTRQLLWEVPTTTTTTTEAPTTTTTTTAAPSYMFSISEPVIDPNQQTAVLLWSSRNISTTSGYWKYESNGVVSSVYQGTESTPSETPAGEGGKGAKGTNVNLGSGNITIISCDINGNPIGTITQMVLNNLNITSFNGSHPDLSGLTKLSLVDNNISSLDVSSLTNLTHLYLANLYGLHVNPMTPQSNTDILLQLDANGLQNGIFATSGGRVTSQASEAAYLSLNSKGWALGGLSAV